MAMTLGEQMRLLSVVDVFEPLSQEELEELARRAPDTHLPEGEVFLAPLEHGERLYVLKVGQAQIYEVDPHNGKETMLSIVEAGQIFGEMALTAQRRMPGVYAKATKPSVVCSLRRKDVVGRLASTILRLVGREGVLTEDGTMISGRYTNERLGAMIGAKHVAVSRALKFLREAGAAEKKQRRVYVRDRQ